MIKRIIIVYLKKEILKRKHSYQSTTVIFGKQLCKFRISTYQLKKEKDKM